MSIDTDKIIIISAYMMTYKSVFMLDGE